MRDWRRENRLKRSSAITIAVLLAIFFVCLVGAALSGDTAYAIDNVHWQGNPLPPCFLDAHACGGHLLGSDENGRDILARIFAGSKLSMLLALANTVLALGIGLAAGLLRGRIHGTIAAFANGVAAYPLWVMGMMFCAVTMPHKLGASSWLTLSIIYGCFLWPAILRAVSRRQPLIPAAFGVAAQAVLADAIVNFFGYGVQPPIATLGNMIANGESNLETAPWAVLAPAAMLTLIVLLCRIVATPPLASAQITKRTESIASVCG